MNRTRTGGALLAAMVTLMLVVPLVALAGNRVPVNSTDSAASPVANRIAAVTNIVNATNARLSRVMTAYPPNPCLEVSAVCTDAAAAVAAYAALGLAVADACAGAPHIGPGDTVITDGDAFSADTSPRGIANQLASITTVLGNANDRLGGIRIPNPGPPDAPVAAAFNALSAAVSDGGLAADGWIGGIGGFDYPPNPCGS